MKFRLVIFLFSISALYAQAQLGGQNVYEFLNLNTSARNVAIGGSNYAFDDGSIEQGFKNPSLITSEMGQQLSLNYTNYMADINFGQVGYALNSEKIGTILLGIQYMSYGKFERADPTGTITGEFFAADYALSGSYAYQIDSNFSVGTSIKLIYSAYAEYSSVGLGTDWAFAYRIPKADFTTTAIIRNLGFQITAYDQVRESLPFEIDLAVSKKLAHMPLRWHLTLENLQQFDLSYTNPQASTVDPSTGNTIEEKVSFGNKVLRHVVIGGELFTGKMINFRFGYNFRRQSEMKLTTRRSNAGFTWGIGINTKKFRLDYGRAIYHVAGGTNQISVTADLEELFGF